MFRFSNRLTPAEDERLAFLMEECGEAIQVIGKIMRHGFDSRDPTVAASPTNRRMLEKELGDIQTAILLLVEAMDVDEKRIVRRIPQKLEKFSRYQHHQSKQLEALEHSVGRWLEVLCSRFKTGGTDDSRSGARDAGE